MLRRKFPLHFGFLLTSYYGQLLNFAKYKDKIFENIAFVNTIARY